jgi:uncharacterized membrane protein YhhN
MTDGWLFLTITVFTIFFLDWLAVCNSWRRVECILKPLVMVLVILWTMSGAGFRFYPIIVLLVLAQLFGLAGDVFLLWRNRLFLWGLGAFLVGHFLYMSIMFGLLRNAFSIFGIRDQMVWWLAVCILLWAIFLGLFYRIIAPYHLRVTMPLMLRISVQFYGWILSGMVILSILVVLSSPAFSILYLALPLGATLFLVSDSLLAYDRFKRKMPKVRVWIMITYHLAQFSLAAGVLMLMNISGG